MFTIALGLDDAGDFETAVSRCRLSLARRTRRRQFDQLRAVAQTVYFTSAASAPASAYFFAVLTGFGDVLRLCVADGLIETGRRDQR
jgi:hypothetical protein